MNRSSPCSSALLILLATTSCVAPRNLDSPGMRAWNSDAFAQALAAPVGQTPVIFAPGLISDGMYQRDAALSDDGQHFLYTLQYSGKVTLMHVEQRDGWWRQPRVVSFAGDWHDLEPAFRPSTLELYFASTRPLPGETEIGDYNLWRTRWQQGEWVEPEPVPDVNEAGNEFYPSLTESGTLYFTSTRDGGAGGEDIWVAEAAGDGFAIPKSLAGGVNTAADEFNAAINADGSLLVFGSQRNDGPGGGDLYLSIPGLAAEWLPASLLWQQINTPWLDFCPYFSADGVLWFTSTRRQIQPLHPGATQAKLRAAAQASGNSFGNLYRIRLQN
jgi:WD40 repeat protein